MKIKAILAVALLSAGTFACSDSESDAERTARLEAEARSRVTEDQCLEAVKDQYASDASAAIRSDCRRAGYDPVWEQHGIMATDEHYAEFAKTGETELEHDRRCPGPAKLVRYQVSGSAAYASMTLATGTGTAQGDYDLPLRTKSGERGLSACFAPGDFLYISAQLPVGSGDISCSIEVDGKVISRNTSNGAYAIVTCDGSA